MPLQLIVDGNDSHVGRCDVILCSFLRVHFNGRSNLWRSHCHCCNEEINRSSSMKTEQSVILSSNFCENIAHPTCCVNYLFSSCSVLIPFLNNDTMIAKRYASWYAVSAPLAMWIILILLKRTFVDASKQLGELV